MRMPTFLLIGAMRSGTTSVYEWLKQHPEIFMSPVKEVSFFAANDEAIDELDYPYIVKSLEDYLALSRPSRGQRAIGEASTSYLYSSIAPDRIRAHIPNAKLIAILRNPVDRAYSHYWFLRLLGRESIPEFEEAVRQEEQRIRNRCPMGHYIQRGFYYRQLKRYYERFSPEQIRVYLYEDLVNEALQMIRELYDFLGVNSTYRPNLAMVAQPSGKPRNPLVQVALTTVLAHRSQLKRFVPRRLRPELRMLEQEVIRRLAPKPPLNPETRRWLIEVYRSDILNLQDLIRRDLSHWLLQE